MLFKHSMLLKSGAIAAALMFMAATAYLFDNFVRMASTQMLQITLSDISKGAEVAVHDATQTLDEVAAANVSICTPEFLSAVRQTMQHSIYVRQILVENKHGARYCAGLEVDFDYRILSEELPIPGREETLAAIRVLGNETNLLRITHHVDENRTISAFVHFAPILATGQLPGIASWGDILRVEFTEGTNLMSRGDVSAFDFDAPTGSHIFAEALAGSVPVRTLGSVPIEDVRAQYWNMYLVVFGVVLLFASAGVVLVIRKIHRPGPPENNLEYAMAAGEIVPFYQPIVDLTSGSIIGCEVLARWVKPDGRCVMPETFVPYAEAADLSIELTHCLLRQVAKDAKVLWKMQAKSKIYINLTSGVLADIHVVEDVQNIFGQDEAHLSNLVFEVDGGANLDADKSIKTVDGLRDIGCAIALVGTDDALGDLEIGKTLGVKTIKLVAPNVESGLTGRLKALVSMAKAASFDLVAQRVESKEQAAILRGSGITKVQGYMISPALNAPQYLEMLTRMNDVHGDEQEPSENAAIVETKSAA